MQRRVQFDFDIEFANGGSLHGEEFRLDIDGTDIDDRSLADEIVHDLRLLMVGDITISNKSYIDEPHKRTTVEPAEYELVDLSHRIRHGMVANTGTYMDAPFHRYEDGHDIAALPLDRLVGVPAVVVDAARTTAIDASVFADVETWGRAVLIRTGWDRHFETPEYLGDHPHLTEDGAERLRDGGATVVGIDSTNIDPNNSGERPAHSRLLAAQIPIIEHLRGLDRITAGQTFELFAIPAPIVGMGTFPVRVVARIPGVNLV